MFCKLSLSLYLMFGLEILGLLCVTTFTSGRVKTKKACCQQRMKHWPRQNPFVFTLEEYCGYLTPNLHTLFPWTHQTATQFIAQFTSCSREQIRSVFSKQNLFTPELAISPLILMRYKQLPLQFNPLNFKFNFVSNCVLWNKCMRLHNVRLVRRTFKTLSMLKALPENIFRKCIVWCLVLKITIENYF